MPGPALAELVVADDAAAWSALGFAAADGGIALGAVRVRLAGRAAGDGIAGWALTGLASTDLDGLATTASDEPPSAAPGEHPNGATSIDHVVVLTPSLDRTAGAFERAGLHLRRVREAGEVRQGFFRAGEVIVEVVERADLEDGEPARFWGLVVVVADVDACAELLGERLGEVRDAVQPGRRITTVRRSAGLALPVALMSPQPPRA